MHDIVFGVAMSFYSAFPYIKRRCNLRLIQKETGELPPEELHISLQDMVSAMRPMGIYADLRWTSQRKYTAEFLIYLFDMLEYILEYERFSAVEMMISVEQESISFVVKNSVSGSPMEHTIPAAPDGCNMMRKDIDGGYCLCLTESGD